LRAALREDPDFILVGEMRDLETMQMAVSSAETGHLVFATLHTNSAASTVDRIVDSFPPGQQEQIRLQLSNNLQAVLCQQLLPRHNQPGRICAQEIKMGTDGHVLIYDRSFFFGGGGSILFPVTTYASMKQLFEVVSQGNEHTITLKQSTN